ncbi:MAG: VCBS repeat-containing protein, partial [Hormoscilla sp. GM102CHS1]|nr:VCBS repeat-containing protein [Hormoscilla sp. GM102CHS1]MBC6472290.1 VCBS repeat-containing protein [Hormoscilla sp. GM102CHS1]
MSTPTFGKPQTNPFGLADVGFVNKPTLADLDGDEDLDLLVGESNGNLIYHENQSTASAPTFGTPQTTSFGLANSDVYSSPTFADIDADGDLDIFVGGSHPHMMTYQENQGTASSPTFGTLQTNPFGLAHVNSFSSPTLADLDGDEDLDLLVGNYHGNLIYQENEGTAKAPTFGKP